jgi:uncharacterized SAM-dependent methyltransferase
MDKKSKLDLIKLSAIDFEGFKKKFETLSFTEQAEFNQHIDLIQTYLKANERQRIEDRTGFPPPN